MTLRLTDEESEALRVAAARENRSMQEVARTAISSYVTNREAEMRAMFAQIATRDAEVLKRLGS